MKSLLSIGLVLIWASFSSAYSLRDVLTLGKSNTGLRIVGGRDAEPHEFPYIVSLKWHSAGDTSKHGCGGSILNERWILTAAHCVVGERKGFYEVRAGAHYLNQTMDGEQTSLISKTIVHPDYDVNKIVGPNDIALLELESPLTFSATVQPIALPAQDQILYDVPAIVSGWGSTSNMTTPIWPNTLQTVEVPVITNPKCQEVNQRNEAIYPQEICTLADGMGGCRADSGGPLVQNNHLIGVSAWAPVLCDGFTAFGRVSFFTNWINSYIN